MHVIVPASASDAEAMAALYREVYPAAPGHAVGHGYPFPQYMNRDWLAKCLEGDDFYWLVAKRDDNLLGCLGAATDIGALRGDDRVAEFTGLIVREEWRRLGIGQSLLKAMCDALEDRVEFMLAETRTGNLGGWKGTLKAGFIPLGFEPLAHNMLGRHEPMIMMGRVSPSAIRLRRLDYQTSPTAHRLGSRCLRAPRLPMPSCIGVMPVPAESVSLLSKSGGSGPGDAPHSPAFAPGSGHDALFVDQTESSFPDADWIDPTDPQDHSSGVLNLRRIKGSNLGEVRFLEKHFVGRARNRVLGVARVSVDLLDRRARVIHLQVRSQGLQAPFLMKIVHQLNAELARHGLAVIVVDVRADFPALHASLEALGFFPTVYYPALIAGECGRVDAVQFTRICGEDVGDAPAILPELDQETAKIAQTVLSLGRAVDSSGQEQSQAARS